MTIPRFTFIDGPWECSRLPSIVREHPEGNDDIVLAQLSRIGHPAELYDLCRLANAALKAGLTPEDGAP
jgi:hypothetical protein